jgi:hypothetical protein
MRVLGQTLFNWEDPDGYRLRRLVGGHHSPALELLWFPDGLATGNIVVDVAPLHDREHA